jgi:FkbM family methyltransferase
MCNKLGINSLIECGAYDAELSRKFLRKSADRHAWAFEINPLVYSHYKSINALPNLRYLNLGLSDAAEDSYLMIPRRTPAAWSMEASLSNRKEKEDTDLVPVKLETLDMVMKSDFILGETALWIDVEGHSAKLLAGAEKILNDPRCLLLHIEVQDIEIWEKEFVADEICEVLNNFDFKPILMDCPLADLFNIIFIKSDYETVVSKEIQFYWYSIGGLTVPRFETISIREGISRLKRLLLRINSDKWRKLIHSVAAKMGSKSSKY